jgi:hypothetical protein
MGREVYRGLGERETMEKERETMMMMVMERMEANKHDTK